MTEACEVANFVALLEEHVDVLLKSQTTLSKNKKNEAVALIIPKWEEVSKVKLTHASLFKKINNLKSRAKSALKSGKTLSEWQAKLLKIIQIDIDDEEDESQAMDLDDQVTVTTNLQPTIKKLTAEQVLNNLETDETKLLSNEQLKRYVLLQQSRVLTLQRTRLEDLNNAQSDKNVTFDFIGFEQEFGDVNQSITKPSD